MILYRERQRFTQAWLWALVLAIAALSWYAAYRQLIQRLPFGSNSASDGILFAVWLGAGLVLPLFLFLLQLRTEVRSDGVYLRFFPLHVKFRRWLFDDIAEAEPVQYSPVRDYVGWGIRYGRRGWAYTVRGNTGVRILLRSGKQILIGADDPDRLSYAIHTGMRRKKDGEW